MTPKKFVTIGQAAALWIEHVRYLAEEVVVEGCDLAEGIGDLQQQIVGVVGVADRLPERVLLTDLVVVAVVGVNVGPAQRVDVVRLR